MTTSLYVLKRVAFGPPDRAAVLREPLTVTLKRGIDIVISAILLPLLLPLLATIALAIRLTSRGPVVFRQTRIGYRARAFTMYKFRTMQVDSSAYEDQLADRQAGRIFLKLERDPRVTPVGRFLRKYSLDELPQLVNVLRGDMSLVGPRPLLPCDYRKFPPGHWARRFDMKPGLSGLWQVSGRSLCSDRDRLRFDLEYVAGWDLWLDLKILLRTPGAVVSARGAY